MLLPNSHAISCHRHQWQTRTTLVGSKVPAKGGFAVAPLKPATKRVRRSVAHCGRVVGGPASTDGGGVVRAKRSRELSGSQAL